MKLLIVGSGGREHCLAWKFLQNPEVSTIYLAPGNAASAICERIKNIPLYTIKELVEFAQQEIIDLTIVGSEALLVEGIVDQFQAKGLAIFGANQQAAMLEGSKDFAKAFMQKYGVKTAPFERFTESKGALDYVQTANFPLVIKASGLAAGKGVIICQNLSEAEKAIDNIMNKKIFGDAGQCIVIEQFLQGVEISILSITDGKAIIPMLSARDHKKIGENNTGLNTGGMGVIAPSPDYTPEIEQAFYQDILEPTLTGLKAENMVFAGVIFFGLMVTKDGVYLLEYNMRLGDPETQAILPLLENDLLDMIRKTQQGKAADVSLTFKPQTSCVVVASAKGYPESFVTNEHIVSLPKNEETNLCFFAGTKEKNGEFYTNGGRVLNIVGLGNNLEQARQQAYQSMEKVQFNGIYYRRDIGL